MEYLQVRIGKLEQRCRRLATACAGLAIALAGLCALGAAGLVGPVTTDKIVISGNGLDFVTADGRLVGRWLVAYGANQLELSYPDGAYGFISPRGVGFQGVQESSGLHHSSGLDWRTLVLNTCNARDELVGRVEAGWSPTTNGYPRVVAQAADMKAGMIEQAIAGPNRAELNAKAAPSLELAGQTQTWVLTQE